MCTRLRNFGIRFVGEIVVPFAAAGLFATVIPAPPAVLGNMRDHEAVLSALVNDLPALHPDLPENGYSFVRVDTASPVVTGSLGPGRSAERWLGWRA